jgi:hypothetical protein
MRVLRIALALELFYSWMPGQAWPIFLFLELEQSANQVELKPEMPDYLRSFAIPCGGKGPKE